MMNTNDEEAQAISDAEIKMQAVRLMRSGRIRKAKDLLRELQADFPAETEARLRDLLRQAAYSFARYE